MAWATHALQSGRSEKAGAWLAFPQEAVTHDLSSKYAVHPWRIESLLNEVLASPKLVPVPNRLNRQLDCRQFSAIAHVSNTLSELENAMDGIALKRVNVLREMHRLSQRQFEWQRGFLSISQFYRAAYLYGGDLTGAHFAQTNGFSVQDLMLACFALRTLFRDTPVFRRGQSMKEIGISDDTLGAVLDLITMPHAKARARATQLRSGAGHISYKRSVFREHPCIAFGSMNERLHAPLPDLISLRATSGVFYDAVKGGQTVRNEISSRFEQYCLSYLQSMLPSHLITGSYKYPVERNQIESPDILVHHQKAISLILECKATRMNYEARFSDNPLGDARRGYEEIAKGVFQIWRFASHCRRGLPQLQPLRSDVKGIVLTLDTWLSMANAMQSDVLDIARSMAASRAPEMAEADQIPVIFCPIDDLEHTLSEATETSFFEAVNAATEDRYRGWMLWGVHGEIAPDVKENNGYPFEQRMPEVLPWWRRFDDERAAKITQESP